MTRILGNIGAITASNFAGRLFLLFLNAAIARVYGAEGLGGYASAVAVSAYFLLGADMGLSPRLVREGAVDPEGIDEEYSRATALKVPITAIALVILWVLFLTLPYEPDVLALCMLMSLNSLVQSWSYLNHGVCRAREHLGLEAISGILHAIFFAGGAAILVGFGAPLIVVGVMALVSACGQWFWSRSFARRFARLRLGWPPKWSALRDAAPYATASLSGVAFQQIDILMMSVMTSLSTVGEYAAITRLLRMTGFLSNMAGNAVLPTASRVYSRSADRFREVSAPALAFSLGAGGAVATGLVAGAALLLRWIFGESFERLAPLFQLGSLYAWLTFGSAAGAMLLTACGRQGIRARSLTLATLGKAAGVLFLVPTLGVLGGVVALLIGEALLLLTYLHGLRGAVAFAGIFRTLVSTFLAFAIGTASFFAAQDAGWHLLLVLATPLMVYPLVLLLTGEAHRARSFLQADR